MEENNSSVFSLITRLCEKYFTNPDKIKSLRSNYYELLLGKKTYTDPRKFKDLQGTTDPMINLLSWCYRLTHEFELKESAENLQSCIEKLKECFSNDVESFNCILKFMMCLRDIPKENDNKLDLSTIPEVENQIPNFESMFKLPSSLLGELEQSRSFKMIQKQKKINIVTPQNSFENPDMRFSRIFQDEGYCSPTKENIWEIAAKMKFSKRKNWENYGNGEPNKEKPFLSELGELSSLWIENLESLYLANLFPSLTLINTKLKARKVFIRDIKYLLVGMPSDTFYVMDEGNFFVTPGIMVEGITPDAIERYSNDFLFCGACYRALNQMSTSNPNTRRYKYPGFVFTEFCESMSRFLQFYRTAVLSISDSTNFLTFHEKTYQIQMQISTLASICKVGPYHSETEEMPHGVALLNYLYQKVLGLSDRNLCMVLYSILYPCCQIYFSRFLLPWILNGSTNDPYGEFFIAKNLKYISTKGRTYWTRSYEVKEDIVPDFLVDLMDDILFCGKIMNLLKLCNPMNKLCVYLMGKKPLILSCCLTYDQLTQLEQNASKYFLEVSAECGPKFSFNQIMERSLEIDASYLNLIAKKRAVTLRRIELERQKVIQEQHDKKFEELTMLKEQYEAALEQKQLNIYKEIKKEISIMKENLNIDQMREKLIEEEAKKMIDYYSELCQVAENRKDKIKNYIKTVQSIHIDNNVMEKDQYKSIESIPDKGNSSTESFYSVSEEAPEITEKQAVKSKIHIEEQPAMHSSQSLDIINANINEKQLDHNDIIAHSTQKSPESLNGNIQQAINNFAFARKIKQKVLSEELGITPYSWEQNTVKETKENPAVVNLTEAQRNKLKVLSSEFGIEVIREDLRTDRILTVAQINRNKILGTNECFTGNYGEKKLDNENFVNRNLRNIPVGYTGTLDNPKSNILRKSRSLLLDFDRLSTKSDSEKPVPMSVDSTPLSDLPQTATPMSDFPRSNTPSTMFLSVDTKLDSFPNTADTQQSESVFNFDGTLKTTIVPIYYNRKIEDSRPASTFSKRVTQEEAQGISKNCLKLFLHESVSIPLLTQLKLANNQIFKFFVEDLNYLKHLISLRDYFFMQDGEFGRNIIENLFEKLYNANFPLELINCRTLQHLVFSALDNSSKYQENSKFLSFKINNLPKCFDLGDPDVLDCLSLTYKVKWPLNILLPTDTVSKYDQVFKYLIKLNRVSWVLKKIFWELKVLAKETGEKEIYLMSSPQYRRLHQCRHVMTHFMQTLQNYIVGEVLQPSWELFERSLVNVTNIDELYIVHTNYIKNILFRCLLNQKTVALRAIVQKIFVVILKFYDYLRSRNWICEDGAYVHPNFNKLNKIFKNFEEFVVYLFKVGKKVAKSGYQPHLLQFLDVLNVNDYYSKKLLSKA